MSEVRLFPMKRRIVSDASTRSSEAGALRTPVKRRQDIPPAKRKDGGSAGDFIIKDPYEKRSHSPGLKNPGGNVPVPPQAALESMSKFWKFLESAHDGNKGWSGISKLACSLPENEFKDKLWKAYRNQVVPLEMATPTCSKLYGEVLTKADLAAAPLLMVVAQHERLHKDAFVAKLVDADVFPTDAPFWDTKFVFVTHEQNTRTHRPTPRRPNRGKLRYMGECSTPEEQYPQQRIDQLSDRCRTCCPGMIRHPHHQQTSKSNAFSSQTGAAPSSASITLLTGREVGTLWDKLLNLDIIKATFGSPFLDAHVCGHVASTPALAKFHVLSCPDVPEDPPPDYGYELALRYFAQKSERIYLLLDITRDIDQRLHLAIEALGDFQSRLAFVFTSPEPCTDIGYWLNRYNFTAWNLSKILLASRPVPHTSCNMPMIIKSPRIYVRLFAKCDTACAWYRSDIYDAWADLRDLSKFQVTRLAFDARRRAVVALVLATFHNFVFRTLTLKRRELRSGSAGKAKTRLRQAQLSVRKLLMPTQSGNWKRMNVGSRGLGSASQTVAEQELQSVNHQRDVPLCSALKQLDWVQSLGPEFPHFGAELLLALQDAIMYKEYAINVHIEDTLMEAALVGYQKLTRIAEKLHTKHSEMFVDFDPMGSLGEGRAHFDEVIPVNEHSSFDRTFQQALVEQNTERISVMLITHRELPFPVPNGTAQRTVDITVSKSSEGVTREEFLTIMHLTSMKTAGKDLPMLVPHRLVTPWRRKPFAKLAKCWLTEKGASKLPTAQQKLAGNFCMAKKKSYRHLLKDALGLKFGVGPSGEEFGTISAQKPGPVKCASEVTASELGSSRTKSSWSALFDPPRSGSTSSPKRIFKSTPHIAINKAGLPASSMLDKCGWKSNSESRKFVNQKPFKRTRTALSITCAGDHHQQDSDLKTILSSQAFRSNSGFRKSKTPREFLGSSETLRYKSGGTKEPILLSQATSFGKLMDQSRNYDQLGVENCHKKSFTIGTEEKRGCKFSVGNYSCRNRGGSDFLMNIPSNGNAVMEEGCVEPSSQAAAGQSSPASTNLESRTSFDVPELKSSGSSYHQNCEGVTSKHASKPVKKRYIHRLRDKLLKTQPCLSGLIRKKQSLCNILQKAVSNSSPQEMTESAAIICSSRAEEARLVSDMDSVFFACDWVRRGGRIRNKEEGEEDGDSKQVHWNERVHICGEEESETLCSCCDNYGYYPENDGAGEQSSLPSSRKSSPPPEPRIPDFLPSSRRKKRSEAKVKINNVDQVLPNNTSALLLLPDAASQESRVEAGTDSSDDQVTIVADGADYDDDDDDAGDVGLATRHSSSAGPNKSSNVRSNPSHEVLELDEAVLRREEDEFGASGGGGNAPRLSANPRISNGRNQDSVPTPRRSGPGRSASLNSVVQSPQPTSTPDPKATLASTSDSILCKKPGETDEQRIARLLKFGFAPVIPMQNKSGPSHSETPAAEDDEEPEEKEPKPPLQFGFVRIPENPNKPQQEPNQDCENPSQFYGNNQENEEPASRQSVPSEGDPLGGGVQPVSPSLSPVSKASNYTAMLRPGAGNTDDIEALRSRMRARFMLKDRDLPPHAS